jgi:ubiquinone/menaquinone biosynthesis C-methylase UbiE
MKRKKEKEVMDGKEQVAAFAREVKHSPSNIFFLNYLAKETILNGKKILDLGCGTSEISISLLSQNPSIEKIVGIDASQKMLNFGKQRIASLNMSKKITLLKGKIPGIEKILNKKSFDIIFSRSLLHHIPEPNFFWRELEKISKKNTEIFVWDFIRPKSIIRAKKITVDANFRNKYIKKDFYNSLLASFTVEEIKEQLKKTVLNLEVKEINSLFFVVQRNKEIKRGIT